MLDHGHVVQGKWNKNRYKILKFIGEGGIGKVYKVIDMDSKKIWALKISEYLQSITKEYDMLNRFCEIGIVPKVRELDDFYWNNKKLYYIIVEYIEGKNLKEYVKNRPVDVKGYTALTILIGKAFKVLHEKGFVFGDLKLENLMIDDKNGVIKIIDLGGVTPIGFSIKEFTPIYDRASWNKGLRKADEKYDLFSISMLLSMLLMKVNPICPKNNVDKVINRLKDMHINSKLIQLIHKGFYQKEITFEEFINQLEYIYIKDKSNVKNKSVKYDSCSIGINVAFASSILFFLSIICKYF